MNIDRKIDRIQASLSQLKALERSIPIQWRSKGPSRSHQSETSAPVEFRTHKTKFKKKIISNPAAQLDDDRSDDKQQIKTSGFLYAERCCSKRYMDSDSEITTNTPAIEVAHAGGE